MFVEKKWAVVIPSVLKYTFGYPLINIDQESNAEIQQLESLMVSDRFYIEYIKQNMDNIVITFSNWLKELNFSDKIVTAHFYTGRSTNYDYDTWYCDDALIIFTTYGEPFQFISSQTGAPITSRQQIHWMIDNKSVYSRDIKNINSTTMLGTIHLDPYKNITQTHPSNECQVWADPMISYLDTISLQWSSTPKRPTSVFYMGISTTGKHNVQVHSTSAGTWTNKKITKSATMTGSSKMAKH